MGASADIVEVDGEFVMSETILNVETALYEVVEESRKVAHFMAEERDTALPPCGARLQLG